MLRQLNVFALSLMVSMTVAGCQPKDSTSSTTSSTTSGTTGPYLYVATGACYSGNNTTFSATTASNLVYRISLETGTREIIADYSAAPSTSGDSPASIANYDSDYIYVLVENGTAASRRIERVEKAPNGSRSILATNFASQFRDLLVGSDGSLYASRSAAVALVNAAGTIVNAAYHSPSAAPCNTSTTLIPKTVQLSNGKFAFIHATAAQNRIGIMPAGGGITCQVAQAAPNANSFPSAMFYDSTNLKLIVAYAGNAVTTDLNSIYAYTVNETTPTITSPQKIYDAVNYPATHSYLLYGISDMYYDRERGHVYIATAISTATTVVNYAIEKFTYTPSAIGVSNNSVLTRVGSVPFYNYGHDTRCISKMFVAD